MSDLIRRQDAIDAIEYWHGIDASEALEGLPTIEAEPVRHGRWLEYNSFYYELRFKCSVCCNSENMPTRMYKPLWKYCPNCGAKMEVDDED